jgi:Fe2+ or Zn2+ uptake regulation protein
MIQVNKLLNEKGLRITPQRIIILKAILKSNNHPSAENIIKHIKKFHPNKAVGTVYKIIDTF